LYGKNNVRRDVEAGSLITAVQYLRAQKVRKIFLKEMTAIFSTLDILATPESVPAGEQTMARLNPHTPFNDSGFPGLAVPAGFSTSPPGLPLSVQLVGKPFDEETVYAAGYAYESQTRWYERKPAL
jgi:aspartyl-tRNA(Asn)/glutamyl-tRNA(Gln) amidotransferase subunit A